MSRHPVPRPLLLGAAAVAVLPLLAGCADAGPAAVGDVQDVKGATMRFEGQGTFLAPLTSTEFEGAWVGTGWFISPDGLAVTNNHVVSGAGTLNVAIGGDNGDMHPATVLGTSECYDLAVVQVDVAETVPFLSWFDGDIVEGAEVYSAGYPAALGDDYTLTKGIVSQADTEINTSFADVTHAIEHDARIRGGNSGGPLVDPNGAVYGVNYAGEEVNDTNAAIGRDDAEGVVEKLIKGEDVLSLGLNIRGLAPDEATGAPYGIWVQAVQPGSPADKAGIVSGDVLVTLNGVTMGQGGAVDGYCDVLRTAGLDATLDVEVYRTTTGESLEGQINGRELEVVAGGGGGEEPVTTAGFVDVTSDDGRFRVRVPESWSDLSNGEFDGGYQFSASPDGAAFGSSLTVSGILMVAAAGNDPAIEDSLASASASLVTNCPQSEQNLDYADGYYTGLYSYFGCSDDTDVAVVAVNKDDGSTFVILTIILNGVERTNGTLDNIAATFDIVL